MRKHSAAFLTDGEHPVVGFGDAPGFSGTTLTPKGTLAKE